MNAEALPVGTGVDDVILIRYNKLRAGIPECLPPGHVHLLDTDVHTHKCRHGDQHSLS